MSSNNEMFDVVTMQNAMLGVQSNSGCFAATANHMFDNLQNFEAQQGSKVSVSEPYDFVAIDGLVVQNQPIIQKTFDIVVDQAKHVKMSTTVQEGMYSVDKFMDEIGRDAASELGSVIEADVGSLCATVPYRVYSDGVTSISKFLDIANIITKFRTVGMPQGDTNMYLPDTAINGIIDDGLSQFAPDRNNELANSWYIGKFQNVNIYTSNLCPTHTAGTVGTAGTELTVVSSRKVGDSYELVLSGAPNSDASAVVKSDKGYFVDGVAGKTNVRFLTKKGHVITSEKLQFNVLDNGGGSNGSGQVTLLVDPPFISEFGGSQNINTPIVAGMKVKFKPSAKYGMIVASKALYMPMPQLPKVRGFENLSSSSTDPDTGISNRFYLGEKIGENNRMTVLDAIYGRTAKSNYTMAIATTP